MCKNTHKRKKRKSPDDPVRIHQRLTDAEFIERIRKNHDLLPDFIFSDNDMRYAVDILRGWCLSGNPEEANQGRLILKRVGLPGFVPRKTLAMKYKNNPVRLKDDVKKIAEELKEVLPKRGKDRKERGEIAKRLIVEKHGMRLKGRALDDTTNMALGILAYKEHMSFSTLYNLYWRKASERKTLSFNMPVNEMISLLEKPGPFQESNREYERYIFREHIYTEEIRRKIGMLFTPLEKSITALKITLRSISPQKIILPSFKPFPGK